MTPPPWPARDSDHLLVSGTQMAQLESALFASGLPVEALMEKAALAVSRRLRQRRGEILQARGALVLVGPGHNGGDGLVIARELHLAGLDVRIWSPFERHKPLTGAHLRHARWLGIPVLSEAPDPGCGALWIDALLGIGQRQAPAPAIEALLDARQRLQPDRLVAVDVPTGLCADSGRLTGAVAARAAMTISIGLIKTGLLQDRALAWVGELERIELGLPPALLQTLPASQPLALGRGDLAAAPWPRHPEPAAGKYARGRLLVVAGSEAFRGASHLTLAGARASGCGSVRAALPHGVSALLWLSDPEVVLARSLDCSSEGFLDLSGLQPGDLDRLDALLLGPGLGRCGVPPSSASWDGLQAFEGLLLLDADGLNRLADGPSPIAWLRGRRGPTWLTPHRQEFERLFPELAGAPALEAAMAAAVSSQTSLLLKGARSVVAAADGRRWQLRSAAARVARAGLGDVLAGYAAGLAARDIARGGGADAAILALAALAHAQAGQRAARSGDTSPQAVSRRLMNAGE